ncbi:MAG: hypothetical protein LBT54_00200, partial [Bifidobacteriaceae bacterium]|nr:hypothetical protein [Bifidobacteriaceae bacterium]
MASEPRSAKGGVPWDRAEPARIVLVTGPEDLLAERAVDRLIRLVREQDPSAQTTRLDAQSYQPGGLAQAASPSLFAERLIVVVDAVAAAEDAFLADASAYVGAPREEATVILRHRGGVRGKKLLEAVRKAKFPEVGCAAVTRDGDKSQFALGEFRRAERRIEADALRALVEAVGADLRELAAACAQLAGDTVGAVTRRDVDRYYGGRVEATGFKVADAAVAGDTAGALTLARHALATGMDPVPLVAALAAKLRTMAKVGGARRRGLDPVKDLGLAQWQVERARR